MTERRIKRTKPKKTRNWSYNKVWRRGEAQGQENGRNPGGKPDKVTPVPPSQTKVKCGLPQTARDWRYNRVWRRDRVWRRENFKEHLAVVSSLTVTPPKSTTDETRPKKTRNWSYNKVWRRGEAQEQENGRNPGGKPDKVTPVPPSQKKVTPVPPSQTKVTSVPQLQTKVTPVLPSHDKVTPVSPLKTKVTPVPPLQTKLKRDPTQTVVTSVTMSSAPTTNTVPSAEVRVSDTAKTKSASLTTVETATFGTHEPVSTTYDVPCKETQSDPISGTEKTQGKARPNRCSSREDEVQSPADTRGGSSKDKAPNPPVAGDKKHPKESLKRKRCEPQTTISKRFLLEHSAADSQLTSVSVSTFIKTAGVFKMELNINLTLEFCFLYLIYTLFIMLIYMYYSIAFCGVWRPSLTGSVLSSRTSVFESIYSTGLAS
ncbi:uncharacterized protein [Magallana gigas]|uniref:uncharacterized protein isoform X2 n=1 Tax=Magallana gigas TaxID=29159 RepID=UPI0033420586